MNTIRLQNKSTSDLLNFTYSQNSLAKTNFEVLPQHNVIACKGFSDGGLNANIAIIKDALGQWAKQAQCKLSPSELNSLAGLVALKLSNKRLPPGCHGTLDLKEATNILSTRLLPLGTRLAYDKLADKELAKSSATLSTLKKDIVNGITDSNAWQKQLQAELPKIPGWNEAPSETVEKYSKFCLNLVKLLNKCGSCGKKHGADDQSEMNEKYQEACDLSLQEMNNDLKKWIYNFQKDFPGEPLEKPEAQGAAFKMLGNSLNSMIDEYFIKLISGSDMADQKGQSKDYTGNYIDVRLTPASNDTIDQDKDESYMCTISAGKESPEAGNGSVSFGGITNPSSEQPIQLIPDKESMYTQDSGVYYPPTYNIGPLAPGSRAGWFRWRMGNYGSFYRSLLIMSEKLVNDFDSYCKGLNTDQFDMKAAAELQVKVMQFVTTFGAIMKALSGALKQAKSVVDSVQA